MSAVLALVVEESKEGVLNMMHTNNVLIITIPGHWVLPKYSLGQRTKQGVIVGIEYYPRDTLLANQYGELWRYALLANNNDETLEHFPEHQIEPLSPEELRVELLREIEVHQRQVALLMQHLKAVECTCQNSP